MTVILPGARSNGGALVGTNLVAVTQFPTGIDQPWIFIDFAGLFASGLAPTFRPRPPVGASLLAKRPVLAAQIPQAKMISPTLAHLPHVS
ncbi:hypothetical protein BK670_14815 [Pseudomonas fluorescens]|uniref:Uncharacterized protein n=1 Tax=Pseudomonas fluorescens TaxID=294 RepID=A0A423MDS3_PSEFL|nr:hypothetical protein BK670_14815 [Pseudomonas fluorescens]